MSPLLQAIARGAIVQRRAAVELFSLRREPCIRGLARATTLLTLVCLCPFGSAITIVLGCCAIHHAGYAGNDKDDCSRASSHSIAILFRFSGIRPSSAQGLVNTAALSCCI